MQVWTQDYLISAPHRVLFNDKNSFTSAYFMTLSENYKLTPIGPNPRKYPDTFVKRFNSQFNRSKQIMRIKNSFNEK
jgi:isopenicillin N synthase-like dioxygenase